MNRDELERVLFGPRQDQPLKGAGSVRFTAVCAGGADQVLRKAKEVLRVVLEHAGGDSTTEPEWRRVLPAWFVGACALPMTKEQTEAWLARWRKLPPAKRSEEEARAPWSLLDWLYWFQPENRQWTWWDAHVEDRDTLRVAVQVNSWPFPWGSLRWLLLASGATNVTPEA